MNRFIIITGLLLLAIACKNKKDETINPVITENIPGGIGGKFNIALFTLSGKAGVSGKIYIKYGCKSMPSGATIYNDSSATMVEPGFGPHAHFESLKEGFYLLSAKGTYNSKKVSGDTIIEITSTQKASTDYNLQLR